MKDDVFNWFVFFSILIAFGIISFLLWLTRGSNAYLVRKKLKLGALLLSLNGVLLTGCYEETTCYEPLPDSWITINAEEVVEGNISLSNGDTLKGHIQYSHYTNYSYNIKDTNNTKEYAKGKLIASDGAFDEDDEDFEIIINNLIPGIYYLNFYSMAVDDIDSLSNPHESYRMKINN